MVAESERLDPTTLGAAAFGWACRLRVAYLVSFDNRGRPSNVLTP